MLRFTDTKKYVMGIGTAYATSLRDGSIVFWSDRFQEGNTSVSANEAVNSGGVGNGPAIIRYNDPNITVSFTSADYLFFARAAAAGARFGYGAPVEVCQTVLAEGAALTLDVSGGAPVKGPGMREARCFVQTAGERSRVVSDGVSWPVDAATGVVTGFSAEPGKTYLVTYWAARANAAMAVYTGDFNGDPVRFVYRRPIYVNYDPVGKSGDLYGWLIDIIPCLKLNPSTASTNGSQSAFSTTAITGRAVCLDAAEISEDCADCKSAGTPLMYSIVAPCDSGAGVEGLVAELGGLIELEIGETRQLRPGLVVNGKLVRNLPMGDFRFESEDEDVVDVYSDSGEIVGISNGNAAVVVSYSGPTGGEPLTDAVSVRVSGDVPVGSRFVFQKAENALSQSIYLTQSEPNGVSVDWGDGSEAETAAETAARFAHTYAEPGTYTVLVSAADGVTWSPGATIVTVNGETTTTISYGLLGNWYFQSFFPTKYTQLKSAVLDGAVRLTEQKAFAGCCALKSIRIPEGTVAVPAYAFAGCEALESISIPNTVTQVGDYAFYQCSSYDFSALLPCLTAIGRYAFGYCTAIGASLSLVTPSIGAGAFAYCTQLIRVWLRESVSVLEVTETKNNRGEVTGYVGPFYRCSASLVLYAECAEADRPAGWAQHFEIYSGLTAALLVIWRQTSAPEVDLRFVWNALGRTLSIQDEAGSGDGYSFDAQTEQLTVY